MVSDPSVETWRAAMDDATKAVNDALNQLGPPPSLGQTQRDLAASQADLTAMQAERDALAVLNAELKAEATEMRSQAEHWLTKLRETAYDLAKANHRNRILTAENEVVLRRLNDKEGKS